ncbi:BREX-1 system adenine-specific DNA-methyltransferase PglX [Propionivibrio sp.]|uniref:BREX-1 system adenine-specific DNA-methyltransferase PglX n=1 Tax=Propionivibrio sp. TaxID=2212460 RepID=UPI003BF357E2
MNKAKLKTYAPQARKDFIAAVEARANVLGLSEKGGSLDIAASERNGDITVIAGQAWPAKVHDQRQRLIKRMKRDGFAQTVEAVAYTWFNRFAALRFMEIHDYLGHGHRVLSSREGGLPEIIAHATEVSGSLPGLNAAQIADMKLAGNRDGELYRLLLVAQCNALSNAMPFLFERIDDESELLLPGNLERTDSVVAKLVESIQEEDWNEIEVIGWLYQFYISEKKDAVIGKVVKSEDIPAATQLFTPNWIVQYLVQNSVGRLWLMANPGSMLKSQWPYYIEPAEQTPEVQAQLDELIQTRMAEDGGSLNPETITVLDPACGSGHILVEAYDVLKAIYLERGYQARAIPRLILEKNLYGLDIDDRAAQLAGFALMMKARADDRRLLDSPIKLNVLSLQESKGLELDELDSHMKPFGIGRGLLASLLDTFAHAKTFGSLIQIPDGLARGLPALADGMGKAIQSGDVFAEAAGQDLWPLVVQATVLAMKFDAVVANPPYMGGKGMNVTLKDYAKTKFPHSKSDLFAMFIERGFGWCKPTGFNSMVTMQSWMFLSSFESMRGKFLRERTIQTMAHLGARAFGEISGEVVQTTAFILQSRYLSRYKPIFFRLVEGVESEKESTLRGGFGRYDEIFQDDFRKIPGAPLAYWLSEKILDAFANNPTLGEVSQSRVGMNTTNNGRFVRLWHEVSQSKIGLGIISSSEARESNKKWFPYNKGGGFRRWYGNNYSVVNFENDGEAICNYIDNESGGNVASNGRVISRDKYFLPSITWSSITSTFFSARFCDAGFIFDNGGASTFSSSELQKLIVGFLCTGLAFEMLRAINPTLNFQPGNIASLPFPLERLRPKILQIDRIVEELVFIYKKDWDNFEGSWEMKIPPFAISNLGVRSLHNSSEIWHEDAAAAIVRATELETNLNQIFLDAFEMSDRLSTNVPEPQITLARADREKDSQRLISYAIGCMMGRYSLDEPGLIYANSGHIGFDATRYKTFPADSDGIIPITDELWFDDDASNRVREFLNAVWGAETLDENMDWLAESLGKKGTETPEETIRRYLSSNFYKDHLQTYKKRPIYWHFSSGKQGAFQALVYLHRYSEGTLSRLRAEYVVPLTGKMQSRIEMLEKDRDATGSTTARTKIAKQIESLKKKHVELLAYDEKLRHYADMRIQLNLDDGVKVNYGRFGDLLAEVKAVTGGASDE